MSSSAVLSGLTSRIADDLARSDLTTQIAAAINDAIEHYQSTRFYFNETRSVTFSTVAAQSLYTVSDSVSIPLFFDIDDILLTSGGSTWPLDRGDADELEWLVSSNAATGDPYSWAWIAQGVRLYPIPAAIRTIRMVGAIKVAAPTDDTAGNVWMTEAFELIRCHAEGLLYSHTIKDADEGDRCFQLAELSKGRLERETSSKRATGIIRATSF